MICRGQALPEVVDVSLDFGVPKSGHGGTLWRLSTARNPYAAVEGVEVMNAIENLLDFVYSTCKRNLLN